MVQHAFVTVSLKMTSLIRKEPAGSILLQARVGRALGNSGELVRAVSSPLGGGQQGLALHICSMPSA